VGPSRRTALPARLMATSATAVAAWLVGRFGDAIGRAVHRWLGPRNALANQLFDLGDSFAVARTDDCDRSPGLAGAAGAAHLIEIDVGMMVAADVRALA